MQYYGEIISFVVAVLWTATALFAEVAVRRIGAQSLNVIRMILSLIFLSLTMLVMTGTPYPMQTDDKTWLWLSLSGLVGYVMGDFCLFNAYRIIGSRFGQLLMTLSPLVAALSSWILIGETLTWLCVVGIVLTILGISISILNRQVDTERHSRLKLPLHGVLLGVGAAIGQGVGIVLSKIGMDYYSQNVPLESADVVQAIPIASTFIRAIIGAVGFIIMLAVRHEFGALRHALCDGRGMLFASLATIFGPFVGVALSLHAVQYAEAGIASTIMALTPILIIAPSCWFFKHKVTKIEVVGAIISVIGVMLFFI